MQVTDDVYEKSARRIYYKYKYRANLKGVDFSLDFDTFKKIAEQNCTYCGKPPHITPKEGSKAKSAHKNPWIHNSIDRIVNEKGYVKGNCQACCVLCNKLKSNMTEVEFITIVLKIFCHRGLKLLMEERD